MHILPVKVKTIDGRRASTYAILDNDSRSTLIRDDFGQGLTLKGHKKTISFTGVFNR